MQAKLSQVFLFFIIVSFSGLMADSESHFEAGLKHYRLKRYKEAAVEFEKFLAAKPDAELVYQLLKETGSREFVEMLGQRELQAAADRILSLTAQDSRQSRIDKERITQWVQDIEKSSYTPDGSADALVWEARRQLVRVGAPAIPYLVDALNNTKESLLRAEVMLTIASMGKEALLPLIEALHHPVPLVRINVAVALGRTHDARAIAPLKALYERESDPQVKDACFRALGEITGHAADDLPPAKTLFLEDAIAYFRKTPDIMPKIYDHLWLVYYWNESQDRVLWREVPEYAFNELMAEQALYDAVAVDPSFSQAFPWMVCVSFRQLNEVDAMIRQAQGEADQNLIDQLRQRRQEIAKAEMFGPLLGPAVLKDAMAIATDLGDGDLASSILKALGDVAPSTTLQNN